MDRIQLCLAKIESAVNSTEDSNLDWAEDCNIADLMDDALELLCPYLKAQKVMEKSRDVSENFIF